MAYEIFSIVIKTSEFHLLNEEKMQTFSVVYKGVTKIYFQDINFQQSCISELVHIIILYEFELGMTKHIC